MTRTSKLTNADFFPWLARAGASAHQAATKPNNRTSPACGADISVEDAPNSPMCQSMSAWGRLTPSESALSQSHAEVRRSIAATLSLHSDKVHACQRLVGG